MWHSAGYEAGRLDELPSFGPHLRSVWLIKACTFVVPVHFCSSLAPVVSLQVAQRRARPCLVPPTTLAEGLWHVVVWLHVA